MPTYASAMDLVASPTWTDVNSAVTKQVGQIRVAQKVFGSVANPSGQPVPADILEKTIPNKIMFEEGQTKPLVEISAEFALTQNQVANEDTLHEAKSLASMKAAKVALAEDGVLFQGIDYVAPAGINITSRLAYDYGFLGVADDPFAPVNIFARTFPQEIFKTIAAGIQQLTGLGYPGHYALFLETEVMALTHSPLRTTLVTPADRIAPLVLGGFHSSGALKDKNGVKWGLLVSLGGDLTTLYVDTDAVAVFTQTNALGHSLFRVYERIQYVAREPEAFIKIRFEP